MSLRRIRNALGALGALALLAQPALAVDTPWSTFINGASDVGTITSASKFGISVGAAQARFGTADEIDTYWASKLGGDCTATVSVGAITIVCTKTNGAAFTSAATTAIGTSGVTIPLLSTANTWTLGQTFSTAPILGSITGSTQCLHVNTGGTISGTGSDCGSGGGGSLTVTGGGNTTTSTTTLALGNGIGCAGATTTATCNLVFTDTTKTANYSVAATDMANGLSLAGSGATLTLPAASATIFAPGMTLGISTANASGNWTLTNSTGLTLHGLNATTLPPGVSGTLVANPDGTTLDFFPGMQPPSATVLGGVIADGSSISITSAGVASVAALGVSTGKLAANAVTLAKQATNTANTLQGFDGSGNAADVAVSTGLALSGGVLTATGGGGSGGGTFNYSDNGVTLTANTYFVPIGGGGIPQTTEAAVDVAAPAAATVANLQVGISAAPGAGNSYVFTLRDGGASQTLTCTISGASATSCSDTTHSVNIAKGDLVAWQIVSSGTIVTTPTVTIAASNGTSGVGVTSVATIGPITGGTITTTGTIACATCVTSAASLTAHAPVIGAGSQASLTTAAMTNGQILIGSTGADPVPASITAGTNITVTPSAGGITIAASGGGSSAPALPQGRLTLSTGKPVMQADVTAATTLFYDTYQGNQVPVWNGSSMIGLTITADEVSMGLSATNHPASGFFDVFAVNNSVALAPCTVAWTNGTTRASAISLKNGVWTITSAPAHCFGGASGTTDYGSSGNGAIGGANQATLLGCMATTTTNGQTAMQFTPAAASGGTNTWRGLTNIYNTKTQASTVTDSTATWVVAGSTFAAMHASTSWRVNYIDCLGQLAPQANLSIGVTGGGAQDEQAGVCLNSTSCTPVMIGLSGNGTGFFASVVADTLNPALGFNFVQAVEAFVSGGSGPTIQGTGGGTARSSMRISLEY